MLSLETVDMWSKVHDLGGGHHRNCGCATPGIGSRKWGYPANCGHVSTGSGPGWWSHPRDCAYMTPATGSGEKCYPRDCGMWPQVQGWIGVNLEIVILWSWMHGLGGSIHGYYGYVSILPCVLQVISCESLLPSSLASHVRLSFSKLHCSSADSLDRTV